MREEISIAHRILPSRLASRDALREGKTSRLASRDALREGKTSRLASRDARREGKTSRLASRDARREEKNIAPRIARCEARGENIAPRIARCEARGKKHRASHRAMRGAMFFHRKTCPNFHRWRDIINQSASCKRPNVINFTFSA